MLGKRMLSEHDRIVLTRDIPTLGLKAGDAGTIVGVRQEDLLEVEFCTLLGNTAIAATVPVAHVRPVRSTDLTHARVVDDISELAPAPR